MAAYPEKVEVAWKVINQFIEDWQNDPYHWINEFSIQSEIYQRLKTVYTYFGWNKVEAKYTDKWVLDGYEEKQNWSRVVCEQKMNYKWQKKLYSCFPDIIIKNDIANPHKPYDLKYDNWPSLFVCEIKVDGKEQKEDDWDDIKKLRELIKMPDAVDYACWLNFKFKLGLKKPYHVWHTDSKNLFVCNITVPDLKTKKKK